MAGEAEREGGTGQDPRGEGGAGPRLLSTASWPRVSSQLSPGVSLSPEDPSLPMFLGKRLSSTGTLRPHPPSTANRTLGIQITLRDVQHHELYLADKLIFHLPEEAPPVEFSRNVISQLELLNHNLLLVAGICD